MQMHLYTYISNVATTKAVVGRINTDMQPTGPFGGAMLQRRAAVQRFKFSREASASLDLPTTRSDLVAYNYHNLHGAAAKALLTEAHWPEHIRKHRHLWLAGAEAQVR